MERLGRNTSPYIAWAHTATVSHVVGQRGRRTRFTYDDLQRGDLSPFSPSLHIPLIFIQFLKDCSGLFKGLINLIYLTRSVSIGIQHHP